MAKTKEEYLVELQRRAEATEALKNHRTMGMKLLHAAGALAAAGVIAAGGMAVSSSSAKDAYQIMVEGGPVSYEFLDYGNTFAEWNSTVPGNDVNVLLSGGKVCLCDGMAATTVKPKQGQAVVILGASYLNKQGNEYIYRNDHSRKILAMDPATQKQRVIFDGNAGEVMCEGGYAYFVNFDARSHIYRVKLDEDGTPEEVIAKPVQSFASIGDSILYLTTEGSLYVKQKDEKVPSLICQHVERFFVAGRILAESQDAIMDFTPMGKDARLIYQGNNKDMRMVGAEPGTIYLQEEGKLYKLSGGEKNAIVDTPHSLYGSLALNAEGTGFVYEQFKDEAGRISEAIVPVTKEAK